MLAVNAIGSAKATAVRQKVGLSAVLYFIYAAYYISGYSSQLHNYVLIALFALWAFIAIAEDSNAFNKAFNNKTTIWAILFVFYFFATSLLHGGIINTLEYIAKYILLFACVFQFKYYKTRNNARELKFIVISTVTVWTLFAVNAIAFYIAVPSAARTLASDFYAFDNIAIGGGYAIAFGSAILCVYLFEQFINGGIAKKSLRLLFIALAVILFYLLIKTESTLTLIACSIGIIFSIIRRLWRTSGQNKNLKKFLLTIFLLSVSFAILLNLQEIGEWIINITKDGTDNVILRRLNRIGEKTAYSATGSTQENYVDERLGYVTQSWETFLQHPILGIGHKFGNVFSSLKNNGLGMHSALCDLLAQHGILGALPFIIFFVTGLKKESWVYCNTYIMTTLFMVLVNPFEYFHAYAAMFMLIPMIDILLERSKPQTSDQSQTKMTKN